MAYNWQKCVKHAIFIALTIFIAESSIFAANRVSSANISVNDGNCISGTFVAKEGGTVIGTITLKNDCTFEMVEIDGNDVNNTSGTYSIDGDLTKGNSTSLSLYVNGRFEGNAYIAWPSEKGICIVLNGYKFEKQ